jgi:hypothetical protein
MIRTSIHKEKAVPLWAAIGAPLVGVPLMVALLALSAPAEHTPTVEPEAGFKTEQLEVQTVEQTIEADCSEQTLRRS